MDVDDIFHNEVLEQLYSRKSVRAFSDRPIGEAERLAILEAAVQAPTAGNQQLYTIIDVTDQSKKEALAESCDHQPFVARGKMVLVFCADCRKWYDAFRYAGCEPRKPGVGDLFIAMDDALIAAQNAVVAAESLGIGSCYIGDIMENCQTQREILDMPEYVFPAALLVFGYPTEQQKERPKPERVALKHIVHENGYRVMDAAELQEMLAGKAVDGGAEALDAPDSAAPGANGDDDTAYLRWIRAFCARKYNSDFAREMSRSVEEFLREYMM